MTFRSNLWLRLLTAAGSVTLACNASAVDPAPVTTSVTVMTDRGSVTGASTPAMNSFLGIPYAAPPVGALRWKAPQPAAPWPKLRATRFANHCPQLPSAFGVVSNTEDCLYLNVFAPAAAGSGARYPVMIWFHGGSNQVNLSDKFGPAGLVAEGVVVVTANYRLGVLGFLSHPALTAESPNHVSGNYAILDQQAVMQWVKRNIANFGGDSDNVTIFGQSAGGLDVHTHLASPLAAGLFHKAIIQSGAYAMSQSSMAANENRGNTFAARNGCPTPTTVECLRSISVDNLLAEPQVATIAAPVVDNYVLRETLNSALASGRFNRVPVMQGATRDEWRINVAQTEIDTGSPLTAAGYPAAIVATLNTNTATRNLILADYPLSNYANPSFALAALTTDVVLSCSARKAIRQIANFVPAFAYEFADPDAPQLFLPPVSFPYGAAHSSDLAYLFDLTTPRPKIPLNASQQQLSRTMMRYWTQFARTGNPNSADGAFWPQYERTTDPFQTLVPPVPFTSSSFAIDHHCAFWAPGT